MCCSGNEAVCIPLIDKRSAANFFIYCFLEDSQLCLAETSPARNEIIKSSSFVTDCHLKLSAAEGTAA